jgi:hypothetical protein
MMKVPTITAIVRATFFSYTTRLEVWAMAFTFIHTCYKYSFFIEKKVEGLLIGLPPPRYSAYS